MTEDEWKGIKEGDLVYMFGIVGTRELIKARKVLQVILDDTTGVPLAIKIEDQHRAGQALHTRHGIELKAATLVEQRIENLKGTLEGREADLKRIRTEIRRLEKRTFQVVGEPNEH